MSVAVSRGGLVPALDRFFSELVPPGSDAKLLVAFSGGPDSSALLWGLERLRQTRPLRVEAAHVDHALDPDSPRRAQRAREICLRLEVPLTVVERRVDPELIRTWGLEAAARVVRYEALEEARGRREATHLVTAHHRDDQIETVLLRLLHGSGWQGLAGIQVRNRAVVRPLLDWTRDQLRQELSSSGLEAARDPANQDLAAERNRLRYELLPYLEGLEPGVGDVCLGVAEAAARARLQVDERLECELAPSRSGDGASLPLEALARLPAPLLPAAAGLLHRIAGASYPPSSAAITELTRQLRLGHRIGSDCGHGWRWQQERGRLQLYRPQASVGQFTYTLRVPGQVDLAEIGLRLRIDRSSVADWMFQGSPTRAGLGAALRDGQTVEVRNRRPGDRLQPLGCSYSRRLKDVLIDRRIPRAERDRIPLLCVDDRIAWVPGVTIDESFRIGNEDRAWVAELAPV